jgi:superfamily I DNA/RNA helicase
MPIPQQDVQAAVQVQQIAAVATEPVVRLVAGPGTGKSSTIEQRVSWLLGNGVNAAEIYAVSFTRASARDLQERIIQHCNQTGQVAGAQIRVSTLHSLALRVLRAAGLLNRYPVDPLVLDQWELENIFDSEFSHDSGIKSKERREEIRRYNEAFWSTGTYQPPNYIPPDPAITQAENNLFLGFHGSRTQSYACVLPGEIVRQCVLEMNAGTIDPVALLNIGHLIVDEFQDLNQMDLDFIHAIASQGVVLFAAGDDDQSVYSFRFASPAGIQQIPNLYANRGLHQLNECFRCMPEILAAANRLIAAFPQPGRIPKNSVSLYRNSNPVAPGIVHRWRFNTGRQEAIAIAQSCNDLVQAGIRPSDIVILLSNSRALEHEITAQMDGLQVPYTSASGEDFVDTESGLFVLSLLRIINNPNDYVAHRAILGLLPGVGVGTCNQLCGLVIQKALNYRNIFHDPLPNGVFTGRILTALNRARAAVTAFQTWTPDDTLGSKRNDFTTILTTNLGAPAAATWAAESGGLPDGLTLREVRDYLWASSDEQRANILTAALDRLGTPPPAGTTLLPDQVRIMTMHGAKGLSGRVVFIPGLEESMLPGPKRAQYPGLVLEAARLLYVSLTRARAVCVVSFASRRTLYGTSQPQTPSRFAAQLNGAFVLRQNGLIGAEVQGIIQHCNLI